jgi:hypothetical protein
MPFTKPKTRTSPPWEGYLVLNADNVVLGVYGSALREYAGQQADKIRSFVPCAEVKVKAFTGDIRPSVGDKVP